MQALIKEAGYGIACPKHAVDLGIDIGYGSSVAKGKHMKRKKEAARRKDKVKMLKFSKGEAGGGARGVARAGPKLSAAKQRFLRTSAWAKANYAGPILGVPWSTLRQQRADLGSVLD
eukprot:883849-Lingulodinium_polyedra.AAC.1